MHLLVEGPVNYSAALASTASLPTSADFRARIVIATSTASIFPAAASMHSVASKGNRGSEVPILEGSRTAWKGSRTAESDREPLEGNAHRSNHSMGTRTARGNRVPLEAVVHRFVDISRRTVSKG